MSIDEIILEILLKPVVRRGGISFSIMGLPTLARRNPKSVNNALSRLKKNQFISFEAKHLVITPEGKQYIKTRKVRMKTFVSPFSKNAPKNLLVLFDIPEIRKAEREWFRFHLHKFGYEMIQRSVWLGPSPLPREFVTYSNSINLDDSIKVFKVSRQSLTTLSNHKN